MMTATGKQSKLFPVLFEIEDFELIRLRQICLLGLETTQEEYMQVGPTEFMATYAFLSS